MNDELIAKTPIGEIVVGIKSDHDYPGIFVELRGEHLNDRFKEGAVRLAWVEYSSDKQCLQTIAYGDGNADRVFLHFKSGIVTELKLGDNPPPGGRINSPKNLEGLLLSGCLGKLSE